MLFIVLFDSYASDFEHPDAILLDPAPAAVGDVFREFRFERRAVNYLAESFAIECIFNSLIQGLRRVLPQKTVSPDYIVHNVFFHATQNENSPLPNFLVAIGGWPARLFIPSVLQTSFQPSTFSLSSTKAGTEHPW